MNLPAGDTGGVCGLCLDPHDLAIAKYVARREKDISFNRALATRGGELLDQTSVDEKTRERIRGYIATDFHTRCG